MSFIEEMHCWQYSMTVFELFSEQTQKNSIIKCIFNFPKKSKSTE